MKTIPQPYGGTNGKPVMDDAVWQAYERQHLEIPWRKPLRMTTFSGSRGFGCRICIARFGIVGKNVPRLPQTALEFDRHIKEYHAKEYHNDEGPHRSTR